MGRSTKTLIPKNKKLLQPQVINPSREQSELQTEKNKQKGYYDTNEKQLSNEPQHCTHDDNIVDTFNNNGDKEQSKIIPPALKIIACDSTNSKYVKKSGRTITTPKQ